MLSLHTNLITNNLNNNFDMFAKINTRESDATYFDKINLSHYNNSNIIKIDIDDGRNKIFKICEIISRLNDFTEAERRVYYCINTLDNITVTNITKHITSIYGYSAMTVKRSLDKFIQCGVITYENNNIINDIKRPMKFKNKEFFIRDGSAFTIIEKVNGVVYQLDKNKTYYTATGLDNALENSE